MILTKILSLFLCFCLILEQGVFAQTIDLSRYFANSGKSVIQSDKFRPLHLRYISYDNQANDFKILLDKGDFFNRQTPKLEEATQELMKYFFIGLSLPNEKFWVNLRPDSPDNILDPDLEKTDIGRIFLEADLQLKKDTSGMTSPQTKEGKEYWDKLYKKAGELFGSQNITIPAITRPWIVPGEIIIGESPEGAYIYKATLKVMLEEDYLRRGGFEPAPTSYGWRTAPTPDQYAFSDPRLKELNQYSTQLIKETLIPKLTYAVNTSKRYAPLRQVYYSLILAQWFKQKYSSSGSVRASGISAPVNSYIDLIDSGDLANLASREPYDKQAYFKQYQKSFQDGEYNLQEPVYTPTGQSIRRYMSGGVLVTKVTDPAIVHTERVPSIKKGYLVSSAVSSEITKKAKILAENILSPAAEKTLFIWNENVNPKIIKQTIKYINENHDQETAKYFTQELIIRIIIETAELKDENEMSQSQRELVGNIMHDAIDPLRTKQLEAHIKNYLGRIKIKDSQGQEYYWDDAKKIYDTAINLEKSFIKDNSYSLLFPVFTVCRILYGRSVYNKIQEAFQSATSNGEDFIVKALIDELVSEENIEKHNAWLKEMRNKNTKALPEEFASKEILFKRPLPLKNLQYLFETNTLYIRSPASNQEDNPKDIWITSVGNLFSIDWLDKNGEFKTSNYEVITIEGANKLIDRLSKAIFDMPGGKIPLDMLINYNEGVKRLLASSSAAAEQPENPAMFETSNGIKYKIIGDFGPVYTDVKIAVAPDGEEMVIKPVRNRDGHAPEIKFVEDLKHPNIVIGKLIQDKEGKKFLLMPYIKGDTLEAFANRKDVPLKDKLHRFYEIISDLTEILAYLETLDLSYNDSRFSPQFDRHFIIDEAGRLKLIDFEQVAELNDLYLRRLYNAIVLIDTVDLLKGSLSSVSLRNEFEQELGQFYGKARNNKFKNLNELCEELKKLIDILINNSVAAKPLTISNDKGGIDFSRPEIITRPISDLQSLADSPLVINPNLDFEGEWRGIQMVFNAGIRPSARRMAEFAASASASPLNSRRLEDVRRLVTDLLRRDEEEKSSAPAEPELKGLLSYSY